jgi:DNA-binding transcriptional MerR regulator
MDEIKRIYYSIGEVAKMLSISPVTIRFYESTFNIKALRSGRRNTYGSRNRKYTEREINELRTVCNLVRVQGYTLKGAMRILQEMRINNGKFKKQET